MRFGGGWGFSIYGLMLKCQKVVTKTLTWGKFSEESIKSAIETIEYYTQKIDNTIEAFKKLSWDKWAKKHVKPDTEDASVYVESYGKASGERAEVNNHVKLGIFDTSKAKLVIASAESYAAAEGGDNPDTYVNTFSKVKGVDTGVISTYYEKGQNYEKAVECLIAIDWESIYDKNLVFKKKYKFYSEKKAELGEGATMTASVDAYVEADNTVKLDNTIEQLAYDDTIEGLASVGATVA